MMSNHFNLVSFGQNMISMPTSMCVVDFYIFSSETTIYKLHEQQHHLVACIVVYFVGDLHNFKGRIFCRLTNTIFQM